MAKEPFLINPIRRGGSEHADLLKRKLRSKIAGLRKKASKRLNDNPLGEEILILGANPVKRKRRSRMLNNSWFGHHAEHRVAALKGWRKRRRHTVGGRKRKKISAKGVASKRKSTRARGRKRGIRIAPSVYGFGMNPVIYDNPRRRRKARRARMSDNPRRRRRARRMLDNRRRVRRARRDNPVIYNDNPRRRRRARRDNPVVSDIKSALPLALTGGVSLIATTMAPSFLGKVAPSIATTTYGKYGSQAAMAIGGGIVVGKFVGKQHGTIWTVVGLATILADVAHKYVLGGVMAGLGLGAYEPGRLGEVVSPYTSQPEYMSGLGAYEQMGGFGDADYSYSPTL